MAGLEIISGPVHTGKTTRLAARLAANPPAYCGILAPVDASGKRYLVNLITNEYRLLDAADGDTDFLEVGRFRFKAEVFEWGQHILQQHHLEYPFRTIVIDEIGKLELNNQGLAPSCWAVMQARVRHQLDVIAVCRESLLEAFKENVSRFR